MTLQNRTVIIQKDKTLSKITIPKLSNSNDFVIAFENVINKGKRGDHKVHLSK